MGGGKGALAAAQSGLGAGARHAEFARAMRQYRPHVYIGFLYWAYTMATPIAALLRVPVRITTRLGMAEGRTSQTLRWMPRFVNALTDVVIANSELVGVEAIAIEGLPESKFRVIHNGVDIGEVADVAVQPPVGLMVANLISYKGHADVITALSLLDDPPTVRFVGEGRERARLERLVEAANLGDRVIFEGSVPNTARLFRDAQFGILASHEESLPNCVLEAMAAGVPMVATSVGGVPELLEDERERSARSSTCTPRRWHPRSIGSSRIPDCVSAWAVQLESEPSSSRGRPACRHTSKSSPK